MFLVNRNEQNYHKKCTIFINFLWSLPEILLSLTFKVFNFVESYINAGRTSNLFLDISSTFNSSRFWNSSGKADRLFSLRSSSVEKEKQ